MSSEPTSSQPATYERLTPGGPAAIIVYRLRGGGVEQFFRRHIRTSRPMHPDSRTVGRVLRAELVDGDETLDDVLVTFHAPPPVWDLRLHIHGGPALDRRCVELLEAAGFAPPVAEPEPLWPTSSAIEAEAWAALPAMLTDRGMRWLLSQAHRLAAAVKRIAAMDDLAAARRECRALCERRVVMDWFSNPLCVVLAGSPNAGKSTLLNALADRHVSIVSDTPGATRDEVETVSESRGFPVVYIDTAGLRSPGDALEAAGISRTRKALAAADVIVWVIDATAETR
ncbi:MAG: GTP-binding protein, partial [Planctomycetota bacterium]